MQLARSTFERSRKRFYEDSFGCHHLHVLRTFFDCAPKVLKLTDYSESIDLEIRQLVIRTFALCGTVRGVSFSLTRSRLQFFRSEYHLVDYSPFELVCPARGNLARANCAGQLELPCGKVLRRWRKNSLLGMS
jgi:hypothetical protein